MFRYSKWFAVGSAGLFAIAAAVGSSAQVKPYPSKPVKIINPAPVGNGPDVIGRIIADRLAQAWGQQILMINRPGAGGLLAAQAAVTAERDGYTLYQANSSSLVVLPETQKLSFDFARDFTPLGLVGEQPFIIAVSPSLGASTLPELIALAKKRSGGILYAAAVRGSLPHLTGELFRTRAGAGLTFVPYPSTTQAVQDIMGGRISMVIESLAALAGPLERGSLTPLAVTTPKRLPNLPDLPTVSELLPGFTATGWFPLLAPAGTPDAIVKQVSRDLRKVLEQPEVQKKLAALGAYARPMSPAETSDFIRREQRQWQPIVKQLDLKQ